jgi:hypothetical protein
MVVSRIKYYKNISTPRYSTWFPYSRSTAFPTQIFRGLLTIFRRVSNMARSLKTSKSVDTICGYTKFELCGASWLARGAEAKH